jgi:hypothetical protein
MFDYQRRHTRKRMVDGLDGRPSNIIYIYILFIYYLYIYVYIYIIYFYIYICFSRDE